MNDEMTEIVYEAIKDYNGYAEKKIDVTRGKDSPLYGEAGSLDSLALVNLIVSLEEKIEEKFSRSVVLADEKAFSQRHSPFATVGALADYLRKVLAR